LHFAFRVFRTWKQGIVFGYWRRSAHPAQASGCCSPEGPLLASVRATGSGEPRQRWLHKIVTLRRHGSADGDEDENGEGEPDAEEDRDAEDEDVRMNKSRRCS
jgi:hypothetical protein